MNNPKTSLEQRVLAHLTTGAPLVAHQLEDREYIEWIAKGLLDKKIAFQENHRVLEGLAERFRKPVLHVEDCTQLKRSDVVWLKEERVLKDWLSEITNGGGNGKSLGGGYVEADARPPRVIVYVHPEMWEATVLEFTALGYEVDNADAPFTNPNELWTARQPA